MGDSPPGATPRLLILDVDGTLLTSQKEFPPPVKAAIRDALAAGLEISLASGRMYSAILPWVREFGLRTPQVCNNGAEVVHPVDGRRLVHHRLDPGRVRALLDLGKRRRLVTLLYSGDSVLGSRRTPDLWLVERNSEMVRIVPETELYDCAGRVEKVLFLARNRPQRVEEFGKELMQSAGRELSISVSEPGILNVCHPKATKMEAVAFLCRVLGITLQECAAVGDGENDVEVLENVGYAVAMGNAVAAARKAAGWIAPDNDHAGAAAAVRRLLEMRSSSRKGNIEAS